MYVTMYSALAEVFVIYILKVNKMETNFVAVLNNDVRPWEKGTYSAPVLYTFGTVSSLTLGGTGTKCDGNHSGTNQAQDPGGGCSSDPSVKENIVRVGTHPIGVGLYLFDYRPEYQKVWGYGRQFGVMADEVEVVMPQAVSMHLDGYRLVDYAKLGISRAIH